MRLDHIPVPDPYQFAHEYEDDLIRIGVHTDNDLHEPVLRWKIESSGETGDRGTVDLPEDMPGGFDQSISEPVFRFYMNESTTTEIAGEGRTSLILPRPLAADINIQLEQVGTAVTDCEYICTDPGKFPSTIEGQDRLGISRTLYKDRWGAGKNIMWYTDEDGTSVPYQIEDGELIKRPQEISIDLDPLIEFAERV
jgi:hypothetical protein